MKEAHCKTSNYIYIPNYIPNKTCSKSIYVYSKDDAKYAMLTQQFLILTEFVILNWYIFQL